jgi:transposase InsO family protein
VLAGKSVNRAIAEVVKLPHVDHLGRPWTLSPRTVRRWVALHAAGDLAALEDKLRARIADSRVLSGELLNFLRQEKKADEAASVPELIRRARIRGLLGDDEQVDRSSVWRACCRMGLAMTRQRRMGERDVRSFVYPNRMLMVLSDGKYFHAGVRRLRRVALVFLDDATRYGLDAYVGTSESTVLFLSGLYQAIARCGLMAALYLDRGPGFISDDTHAVCAHLGIAFIHGEAAYPEGHGKVEKFNQTWEQQVLRGFDGNPEIDPDPSALRARLLHYLHEVYNKTPHEGLGGATPERRFQADPRALVFPQDRAWLDERFVVTFSRRVTKDNLIPYKELDYELPIGHAGREITVHRNLLRGTLSVLHEGRMVEIRPVDRVANAYARRARGSSAEPPATTPIVHTAASLAYQRDFAPIVGADGGYPKGDDEP